MKPEEGTRILAIVGPTGVGKSYVAALDAKALRAEILSVDSMQVYAGMDVGTAKPTEPERKRVPFHLLDVADPKINFSVAGFKEMADETASGIISRGKVPLLVGGSGLYYRAFVDDLDFSKAADPNREEVEEELEDMSEDELHLMLSSLDPRAAAETESSNRRRVIRAIEVARRGDRLMSDRQHSWSDFDSPYDLHVAGLEMERHVLYELLDARFDQMMEDGLLEETRGLVEKGLKKGTTAGEALGYRQLLDHLDGEATLEEAVEQAKRRTRNLAKRQLTWFRKDPRVKWFKIPARHGDDAQTVLTKTEAAALEVLEYLMDKT